MSYLTLTGRHRLFWIITFHWICTYCMDCEGKTLEAFTSILIGESASTSTARPHCRWAACCAYRSACSKAEQRGKDGRRVPPVSCQELARARPATQSVWFVFYV